ncbi:MAG: sigma-70 family RNA polymerase sigma factor [Myxococcota bacterium]
MDTDPEVQAHVDALYREHYSSLLAPLIRILGSFAAAEEVAQDAFVSALGAWSRGGIPDAPLAWLRQVAKNRAIDRYRRRGRWQDREEAVAALQEDRSPTDVEPDEVRDDMLRLVFTCCHPSLAPEAQIALTLHTVCGLTTEEVARSFLLKPTTLAQRLVRAKAKIEKAGIPYSVPSGAELGPRLDTVLKTVYLVFNEGYGAAAGDVLVKGELCGEAIRLARIVAKLLPDRSGPRGLLALMLLHDSRRHARVDAAGDLVPLDEQDRTRWDRGQIAEALELVEPALRERPVSSYAIEAAIAALHARAEVAANTDWAQIAELYRVLEEQSGGNPVVRLNRAAAVALAGDLAGGLSAIDRLEAEGELSGYHLLPAARAELLRRLGRTDEARSAYEQAQSLAANAVERRFMQRRIDALSS